MIPPQPESISVPLGHIVVTTYGMITAETTHHLLALQAQLMNVGIKAKLNIVSGALVDRTRNEVAKGLLQDPKAGWLLMLDADMTFAPTIVEQLLVTAYKHCPWADIVGGWCPLRGEPYLPTIDTGTGTWESTLPNQGPLEVIRTGAACLFVKRQVFERMKAPWFGVRVAPRFLDTLMEFDNFCRIKFDGRNPFENMPQWEQIQQCAVDDTKHISPSGRMDLWLHSVGEDSNFCDKARALGFRIVVDTNAVCGHVDRRVITVDDHKNAMRRADQQEHLACGITEC